MWHFEVVESERLKFAEHAGDSVKQLVDQRCRKTVDTWCKMADAETFKLWEVLEDVKSRVERENEVSSVYVQVREGKDRKWEERR